MFLYGRDDRFMIVEIVRQVCVEDRNIITDYKVIHRVKRAIQESVKVCTCNQYVGFCKDNGVFYALSDSEAADLELIDCTGVAQMRLCI